MSVHLIWAMALVLCCLLCAMPSILSVAELRPTVERYMTRDEFNALNGRVVQAISDKHYYENANKILIDEILHHLQVRKEYKDGVLYFVADIKPSQWANKFPPAGSP